MSTATAPAPVTDPHAKTLTTLTRVFGDGVFSMSRFRDNLRLHVPPARLIDVLTALKTRCGFGLLSELGGVDYLDYPGRSRSRFEVHYVLVNLDTTERLIVKVGVDDPDPTLPSVVPLWPGANWMEREVYDMFGITFAGHPDLRRILMPEEFTAFPLRKDYPLRGRGERHNFPRLRRGES
jgi:NADH-quinone oxidoreductase subunit C